MPTTINQNISVPTFGARGVTINRIAAATLTLSQLIARGGEFRVWADTDRNTVRTSYTRNPACWAYGLDLSCIPANEVDPPYPILGHQGPNIGALVSRRHVICASHYWYAIPLGTAYRFVSRSGEVFSAVSLTWTFFPSNDTLLITLDRDIDPQITPAKVMPQGWQTSYASNALRQPCLAMNQLQEIFVKDYDGAYSNTSPEDNFLTPVAADRLALTKTVVPGDSGSPIFTIVNNKLVLLTTWHFPNSGRSVANQTAHFNAINAAMAVAGSYSLTVSPAV